MSRQKDNKGTAAVAGAGLIGRILATTLASRGWSVTLIDRDTRSGARSCGYVGAGMLAPYCELESAEPLISQLGLESLALWPAFLQRLAAPVEFERKGSIVVAHPSDANDLERLTEKVERTAPEDPDVMQHVDARGLRELEPALGERFQSGLYFPNEGHVNNRDLLRALQQSLEQQGVEWLDQSDVTELTPGSVRVGGTSRKFDWVFDCRGLGAAPDLPDLRGVRGELVYLHAPEVSLRRPIRLMHPRYPIYVVPRRGNIFVIGATSIESDHRGPIRVRSALELLSAAYTVHTGFAEAAMIETAEDCRPALPGNVPRITCQPGLVGINGLYRHGFLLAPVLVERALTYVEQGVIPAGNEQIMTESTIHAHSD